MSDTVIRYKCNPQSDAGQIDQQVIARQFNLGHKVKLVLLEKPVEEFTGSAVSVKHEDRIMGKLLVSQLFSPQVFKSAVGDKDIPEFSDLLYRRYIA